MIDVTNVFGSKNGQGKDTGKPIQFRRTEPPAVWRRPSPTQGVTGSEDDRKSESGSSITSTCVENAGAETVAPEKVIKHPLENTWTLWYFQPLDNISWADSQRKVCDISTCEDFWSLYNHIRNASDLIHGSDYSLFKEGIKPMWEDSANKNGGRWVINIDRRQRTKVIDKYWLEMLLCLIGEAFDDSSDEVCGAVCNVRPRGDKIALWTANFKAETQIMDIGRKLKERLGLEPMRMEYSSHKDTANKVKRGNMKVFTL